MPPARRAVLFLIHHDPRISARPAEAIRVAAGVGAWGRVDITVYLRGPAVAALSESVDELVDEDHFVRYLPIVGEWKRPVYVERGAAALAEVGEATLDYEEIDDLQLAALAARQDLTIRF